MIKITLPDGSVREYQQGVTGMEIAKSISEGLARKVLVASVNGETVDLSKSIDGDATFKLHTWDEWPLKVILGAHLTTQGKFKIFNFPESSPVATL